MDRERATEPQSFPRGFVTRATAEIEGIQVAPRAPRSTSTAETRSPCTITHS